MFQQFINLFNVNFWWIILIFFLLTPLWLLILRDLFSYFYKNKIYKNTISLINNEIWIDNLLDKNWFNNISYPIVFVSKYKEMWIEYIPWLYFDSINKYYEDLFFTESWFLIDEIIYWVDCNFRKYLISFKKLNDFWISNEKYSNILLPFLTITNELVWYDEIEKLLIDNSSMFCYLEDNEKNYFKAKNYPRTIETIIKIIDNKI